MEDMLLGFENDIANIIEIFNKFRDSIGDKPVSKSTKNHIENFIKALNDYEVISDKGSIEEIAEAILNICSSVTSIGLFIDDVGEQTKSHKNDLSGSATALRKKIESSSILKVTLTDKARLNVSSDMQDYRSFKKKLKDNNEKIEELNRRIKKALDESEVKADSLTKQIESLEKTYKSKIGAISLEYEKELKAINDKNSELDTLLGNAAGRVIVSEYALSAEQERKAANWLRICSLVCMVLIVAIAGYSFLESITQSFDLSNALLRLALVFLLSVPAAYLARESTKHRQQQYTHLQTSLDLKAINPYIASLPEEEQHKIKSEIAQRIFAPKDFQSVSNESYPINSQEVIMALISKFGNDKDKSAD
ncbi:hypothetical protein SAMN05660405_01807 [Psychrobacter pacificensis]|uniref:Uncharacterized protein n=1 Tax=Psychrobacter pacificensis TaxID=112002 RepID=A0A1G6YTN4_9GAMM|nr:hypothetical protein [Psychrobacter pacificensis]GLR28565.1 hypothetical protein GCM10007915_08030 [Psychrobacter pacificensis]SDD93423.1 hypothetical protein SAMN05660405_01807 [Psychrobacter pacificensis]